MTPSSTPAMISAQQQLFLSARTHSRFLDRAIPDELLHALYELAKWGPTSMNTQPARYVFVRSAEAKARLRACVAPGNVDKVDAAPVTVIVAQDTQFFEHLPTQFPHAPQAADGFAKDAALAQGTAARNSSLQGGYLIMAARLLGLDCGPMSGFNAQALDAAFFPDGRYRSNFLINLGCGDPAALRPRGPRLPFEAVARIL
ncbi:malonic semialdehyde reductase [Curvibacter sp. HBC61]|uniref:Putative NADH dehydrogenase/NAD(P)H nitroreductase PSQ40_03715 n=1 Tax=Curvibacter cyanobacteriorum TaxID=3026422 RepID=A0ABT5MUE9_9BURK|nr:malonic semialdehyde reductase [Curvibacter sp. HBC61]MDD0837672.1 malonic semialdehyde reductase [Curvibacter sp. HBC61]